MAEEQVETEQPEEINVVVNKDNIALFDGEKLNDELTEPTDFNKLNEKLRSIQDTDEAEQVTPTEDEASTKVVEAKDDLKSDKKIERHKVKANGTSYEFTNEEMLEKFPSVFAKAENYTKKTQELAKDRSTLNVLKENKFSSDDINLMVDVFRGDRDAIREILSRNEMDTVDLEADETDIGYIPNEYHKNTNETEIDTVLNSMKKGKSFDDTIDILHSGWDEESRNILKNDPHSIPVLQEAIESGEFERINTIAQRNKITDNSGIAKSDMDYYIEAESMNKVEPQPKKSSKASTTKNSRKSAGIVNSYNSSDTSQFDFKNSSEEDYDKWYRNVKKY